MCSVVPSEFDSISTGAFSGPSTSTWIGQPFDWIVGMVSPQNGADALLQVPPLLTSDARASQMHQDIHGLPISTASQAAAAAFDHAVLGYLKYRADTPARLTALLEADPDFALAHCMQGYFAMLGFKQAIVPLAVQAARSAESLAAGATPRERSHISPP